MEKLKVQLWGFIIAVVLISGAQLLWRGSADVIWAETAELVSLTPTEARLEVRAYKVRDCKYVADSQIGYAKAEGRDWTEVFFQYLDDPSPNSSRPSSWYNRMSFGIWEWSGVIPDYMDVHQVMATVAHDCGGDILRTTRIGPFTL